jgi:flagellar biosynthesis/type III secretory pathway protein FliH
MANCVCANCRRVMDCTGETLCELCQADMEESTKKKEPNPSTIPQHAQLTLAEIRLATWAYKGLAQLEMLARAAAHRAYNAGHETGWRKGYDEGLATTFLPPVQPEPPETP